MRSYHKRLEQYKSRGISHKEKLADNISNWSGSWNFLILHIIWFTIWIGLKLEVNVLTLIVSLEAIILMSILLMTQTRQAKKDDLRDEADYQADKNSELEINEIKKIVDEINRKLK
ncbi:DUF1003 domain-containing protein [bacterium]|jgi:CRP/FNR family transcriptional regulator, cyclic AMP receptor protein|nr:DUF1003 domain-containing protein [bacterium]MBT4121577.1 DUF1003 domain-containing protein [bacterium]MBT4335424.1 DUF1003 domain-containing protein [bacterium]MBT4495384.1 DUF1003 domain-containing protein [bacterium]MBT4763609.1 DUF1003 domain-containing protein [bacterium]